MGAPISETLEALKAARQTPSEELAKAFTQSGSATSGLTAYDLEAPAKTLYPVLTPLRNKIPRIGGGMGIQANWRAITGINISKLAAGVSEGNRGGIITTRTADYSASFRGLGLEDYITYEADYSAQGFDDVKARAVEGLLRSLMIGEESIILGGNASLALGTTPTPTVVGADTGGTLTGAVSTGTDWSVICVALGFDAYWAVAGFNNGYTGSSTIDATTASVPGAVSRTNADGSTDSYGGGSAQQSAAATGHVGASVGTGSLTATVTAVKGAVAYAWYVGAAGSEKLNQITTINSAKITAASAGGAQAASALTAADHSTNSLVFDGMMTQICKSGSGAYYAAQAVGTAGTGTPLTSDGAGGIVEFETAFQAFWSSYRLSPTDIYVNSQELLNITKKVIANGGSPLIRFNLDANRPSTISAGTVIGTYLNKITNQLVNIVVHPNMPPGTVMFWSDMLPYKLTGVTDIVRIRTRREYNQIEWPLRSRKYEYGVYCDEVLQNYFPPAFGVITNIANG